MFGGIMLGQGLEMMAGLKPRTDAATLLADSLAMLMQFNMAGKVLSESLGQRWAAFNRELHLRSLPALKPSFELAPMAVTAEGVPGANGLWMAENNGEAGGKKPARVLDFGEKKLVRDLGKVLQPRPAAEEKQPLQNFPRITPAEPDPSREDATRLHLETRLEHSNVEVRKLAVILLGQGRNPDARPALLEAQQDPHPHVRILATGALCHLGDARARAALKKEFSDADQHGKVLIISTWRELGDADAIASLKKALRYPNSVVQAAATSALESLSPAEEPKAVEASEEIPLRDLVFQQLFNSDKVSSLGSIELAEKRRKEARESTKTVDLKEVLRLANTDLENIINIHPTRRLSAALRLADALYEDSFSPQQRERLIPTLLGSLEPLERLSFALDFYENFERRESGSRNPGPTFEQDAKLLTLIFQGLDPKGRDALGVKIEQGKEHPDTCDFANACLARMGDKI
jgi:hypothetical protein